METTTGLIEPLIERAEAYGKTSLELLKLKSLDKTSDVASTLMSRLLFAVIISFFLVAINIAAALWLGELLGKNYYGFLIVAAFYGILAIVIYFTHPGIKARINDFLIKQMFN
jgi:hypothetical protein